MAGITAAKPPVETPPIRAKLDNLKATPRTYILQVVANASLEPTDANAALAESLLAPVANHVPAESSKAAVVAPAPTTN